MKRLVLAALLVAGCAPARALPTPIAVRQGPFVVDVRTTATVQPLDSHPVALPPGLWDSNIDMLLPEGTHVKKGDKIAHVSNRHVLENLLSRKDDLANEQATLDRTHANAPVRQWEVQQEIVDKQRAFEEKSLQQKAVTRGGAPDEVAAAKKDVRFGDLALANDPLAAKERLYEKGVIGKQELEQARLDHDLAELNRRQALLALARLGPGARKEDADKARLEAHMAHAAYERARIEAPAKRELVHLEQAKSRVRIRGLQRELHSLQAKVDAATLFAPADGIVLYPLIWNWKKVYIGMGVWPGLVFLNVARLDAVKLQGAVSEAEIARVQVGLPVEITADGYPGRVFAGKVSLVSKLAKEEQGRHGETLAGAKLFDIEVRPDGPTPELLPNMRVNVRVISKSLPTASAVPAEALFGDGDARYIWLAGTQGPEKRTVKAKLWGTDWVALEQPLPADARVYLLDPTKPLGNELAGGAP